MDMKRIQRALKAAGFDPGPIDGIVGPKTEAAIVAFKASRGLRARPYIGPITFKLLTGTELKPQTLRGGGPVPWVRELGKYIGYHEVTDNKALRRWLLSDRATLGDPAKLPWCGDAIETAIKLTLPNEPFPGRVGENPYLARNWLDFGENTDLRYGAIVVFWRGRKSGTSGHVGTVIGHDPVRDRIRCRGGNQSNRVSDAWMDARRVLGFRAPVTYGKDLPLAPAMNSRGQIISTNEA